MGFTQSPAGHSVLFTAKLSAALSVVLAAATIFGGLTGLPSAAAAPASATDESAVPHYFGPYPNWANSPLTTSNAKVAISGDGTGATAQAQIDPLTGGIQQIDILTPGSGYTEAATSVAVTGGDGTGAATATVSATGAVTGFSVGTPGGGYTSFDVALSGGGGAGATAQGAGGVEAVTITDGGAGYTFPTIEFELPDQDGGRVAKAHVATTALDGVDGMDAGGTITKIVVDDAGAGYTKAPGLAIHNGTLYDPISGATPASATTTLTLLSITPVEFGADYTSAPNVVVSDPTGSGSGAVATARTSIGAITGITVTAAGAGYLTTGIKKFQDTLPVACDPATTGSCPAYDSAKTIAEQPKFLPLAVPESKTYNGSQADEFVIGLVQYRTRFSRDLPPTLVRGYVQLETPANAAVSQHVSLQNELLDGTLQDTGYFGVTSPQWLGPIIAATKDRPVRIVFRNLLPTGAKGDLFLPTDSSMMGAGMGPMDGMAAPANDGTVLDEVRNPMCTQAPKPAMCFKDNRATLHLHGGTTPWISDGTPHQWITPANEATDYPQGVSVSNVPDMTGAGCEAADDGCQTFYYTNQQSARLMFYHDHSWGITRLNVYAGEAAGYLITDATEQKLVSDNTIPAAADTLPLIVQDRTFVPGPEQLAAQDPTWDAARWGTKGSFWYHHVYMPAQNPGDPSGMSAYGRWMYGPWFWPPASGTKYGPIDNPYYDPNCSLDDPATWQYQVDPFCEPKQIPGTPNVSAGMEQFNDTPVVNGVAYPTVTLQPKSYRLRMLNAANDRFFNFQWYVADPNQGNGQTEVALNPAELAAAQTDPNVSPTPVQSAATQGPDWIQIGSEGGFLPAPAVIDGQQPTTWITDPTRFDVGNVDKHSMLLAPAERSDAIVDFSAFAGKTLILYNDAPAAFPARVASYDYYTGAPDLSPVGAPKILPGYGPNTRTVMQVKIADTAPAAAFNLTKLQAAFKHTLTGTGVFESGQHPIIVGQAAYNSAYGSSFAGSGNCSVGTLQKCDGLVRINDTSQLNFNTLRSQSTRQTMPLRPKAIHDEMNSSTFDEFGRMQANLGVEASPPTPGAQNVTLYPYVNPQTELIDGTNLPSAETKVTPISSMSDGTQIWRITHNGVDTHPIHFHLYDVQLLNRVTWDNIIIKPDENELGWKDTVRISPLEDTIVALRPVVPKVPFEVPNSVRRLSPMEGATSTMGFNNVDVNGNPTTAITNRLVNFGWEYVYHCHILSHEEMDMMRPVSLAVPPIKPSAVGTTIDAANKVNVSWTDNSGTETAFVVQRSTDGSTWTDVATSASPLDQPNTKGTTRTVVDPTADPNTVYQYRVAAKNTVGYGGQFPSMTVQSLSETFTVGLPVAPSNLTATAGAGTSVALSWTNNGATATGTVVERSADNGVTWSPLTPAPLAATATTYTDSSVTRGVTYTYRVGAVNAAGTAYSNTASISLVAAPSNLTAVAQSPTTVKLAWTDNSATETGFVVERSLDGITWTQIITVSPSTGTGGSVTYSDIAAPIGQALSYRVGAVSGADVVYSNVAAISLVAAPTALTATPQAGPAVGLAWTDNAANETGYVVERSGNGGATWAPLGATLAVNSTTFTDTSVARGATYSYRVGAVNANGRAYSNVVSITVVAAPTNLAITVYGGPKAALAWTDNATNETGYVLQRSTNGGASWSTVVTLAADTSAFTDSTVAAGTTYAYRVGAVNGADTAYSSMVSVTIIAAPTNPSAALRSNPTRVRLSWTDRATGETGYVIHRSTDGGATWSQVGTRGAVGGTGNGVTWDDSAVTLNTTYTYRVQVLNAGSTAYSNQVGILVSMPAVPANVAGTATRVSTSTETLRVTWSDTPNENSFEVQWSTNGSTVSGNVVLGANVTSYSRNLQRRVWYVRVRAFNPLGSGAWSAWVAVPSA